MFDFGPLHKNRKEITEQLMSLPLKTGDIFYRASNAKGPLGLPFSRIISFATNSPYSHAAIALVESDELYVMEVNDQGTLKLRLIDWLDTCYTPEFSIYRYNGINEKLEKEIAIEINKFLQQDPDYDFNFADDSKYYCTESVVQIYRNLGIQIIEPAFIRDCLNKFGFSLFKFGNFCFKCFFNISMPLDKPLYYVGNEKNGMMSSKITGCVFHFNQNNSIINKTGKSLSYFLHSK